MNLIDGDSILYLEFLPLTVNVSDTAGTLKYVPVVALIRRVTVKPARKLALVKVVPVTSTVPPVLTSRVFIYTRYVAPEKPAGGVQVACTLLLLICLSVTLVGGPGSTDLTAFVSTIKTHEFCLNFIIILFAAINHS